MKKIFIFQQLLGVSGQAGQLADRQIGMLEDHGVRNQKLHREGAGFPFVFVRVNCVMESIKIAFAFLCRNRCHGS